MFLKSPLAMGEKSITTAFCTVHLSIHREGSKQSFERVSV